MATSNNTIAHWLTLVEDRLKSLKKANQALSKRQRAKRTRIQEGGTCTRDIAKVLITKKEAKRLKQQKTSSEGNNAEARPATQQRCSNCSKTGHNVRTCQEVKETLDEGSYVASN